MYSVLTYISFSDIQRDRDTERHQTRAKHVFMDLTLYRELVDRFRDDPAMRSRNNVFIVLH